MGQTLTQTGQARQLAPGPPWYRPLSTIHKIRRDLLGFLGESANTYGDVVRYRFGPYTLHFIRHPDHVQHVLQSNHRNYCRSAFYDIMKLLLGEGLLTSDGDFWLKQRRLIQPAFHRKRLANLATVMTEETARMLQRWEEEKATGSFDLVEEMMQLTLYIAARSLFTSNVEDKAKAIAKALIVAQVAFDERTSAILPLPTWLPTPKHIRYQRAFDTLDKIVRDIIVDRQNDEGEHHDLLAMLMELRDEDTGEGMDTKQIRDEVMTLLLAGHETTGNQLSWTWYLLSQHPEIEAKLHAEIEAVVGDRIPTVEDLPKLTYTKQLLQEAMRIYPPAWGMDRKVINDDNIGGYHIPAGSVVIMSQYQTHRHPEFWDEPERFDPDRFSPEASKDRPRFAYFPFGGGPRLCIGNHFAMMEAQLVIVMMAQKYRLSLKPDHPIELQPLITLRPKYGIQVTRELR